MSLWKPEIVDKINRYFVPVLAEGFRSAAKDDVPGAPDYDVTQAIRQRDARWPGRAVQMFVLEPNGTILGDIPLGTSTEKVSEKIKKGLDSYLALTRTPPGEKLATFSEHPPIPQDSILLRAVSRYQQRPTLEQLLTFHPTIPRTDTDDTLALAGYRAAGRDWTVMPTTQWREFEPPGTPTVGATWTISAETVHAILGVLAPENTVTAGTYSPTRSHMTARVVAVSDDATAATVRLDAHFEMRAPDSASPADGGRANGKDQFFTELEAVGYLDYDCSARKVTAFELATTWANFCNERGDKLPFDGIVSLMSDRPVH